MKKGNIADYKAFLGESGNLDAALKYLAETDLAAVEPGVHRIMGDDVYANVQQYNTRPWEEGAFEAHRQYIDIQFVASGEEIITVAPVGALELTEDHFSEGDYGKYADTVRGEDYVLGAGDFLILYPEDGHRPQILCGKSSPVKKFVMKVRL